MTMTLQKINKVDGEKILGSDITKIDENSVSIENAINNLPTSAGSTVEASTTNGDIKINGIDTIVYTHPSGTNPHGTTKTDVGLGNVENTSDLNKPISTATQTALNLKADISIVPTIIALTASEYTAIVTPNVNTLYLIKA